MKKRSAYFDKLFPSLLKNPLPRGLFMLSLFLFVSGCSDKPSLEEQEAQKQQNYASLSWLKHRPHTGLQEELKQLLSDGHTPLQLQAKQFKNPIPFKENVDSEIRKLFTPETTQRLSEQLDSIEFPDSLPLTTHQIQTIRQLQQEYEPLKKRYREALERPQCKIKIELDKGFLEESIPFLDAVKLGNRLDGLLIQIHLHYNDLPQILVTLRYRFRSSSLLRQAPHLECRLAAAYAREDASVVLQQLMNRPDMNRPALEAIHRQFTKELKNWPDEYPPFVSERAKGLHAYEMIRDGHLMSLLSDDELENLRKARKILSFSSHVKNSLDDDEYFFLKTIRNLQREITEKPYHLRADFFDLIHNELEQADKKGSYPLVFDLLFLDELETAYHNLTQEKSRTMAWVALLERSLQIPREAPMINPLTGRPFEVYRSGKYYYLEPFNPANPTELYRVPHVEK
ncbi:MAG: hypothetical protein MPJ24_00850 [Pirellulaceae bacterium]|nr:hypothetical protein [Pirellulaceae bacterium]